MTTTTFAVPAPSQASAPSSGDATSLRTTKPRAADNATGSHSTLVAAIGLTSLASPISPDEASPNPSAMGEKTNSSAIIKSPPLLATPSLSIKPATKKTMASQIMPPRPDAMAMMGVAWPRPSAHFHHLSNAHPAGPALLAAAAHPSALEKQSPWPLMMRPSPAGFDGLQMPPLNPPPPLSLVSGAAIAMDPFSVGERIAAMDRAAAFAARPSPYDNPYYPRYAPLPPLPAPHRLAAAPHVRNKNFPETLFEVVSMAEHGHVISWLSHGKGFVIHDKRLFASVILPTYFDGAKFTSFTRRLKRWDFVRVPRGPELGAYYNKNFVRGRLELVQNMRYQVKTQFEECKEKSEGKEEKSENLDQQGEKEAEDEVQSSSSNKEAQANYSSPSSSSEEDHKPYQNQVLPAKIPSPESNPQHFTNPEERPMQLPSSLPKRPKAKAATSSKATMNPLPMPTPLTKGHPRPVWPPRQVDMQRDLSLPRPVIPHEVAALNASRPFMSVGNGSLLPNHPYYPVNSVTRRMINAQRAGPILETDRSLSQDPRNGTNNGCLGSFQTHKEMMVATMARDMQSRLEPRPGQVSPERRHPRSISVGSSMSPDPMMTQGKFRVENMQHEARRMEAPNGGGERAVMMSQEEEAEFARYLIEKRRARAGPPMA